MKENKGKFFNNHEEGRNPLPGLNGEFFMRMKGAKTTEKKNDKVIAKYFGMTKEDS